MSPQKNVAMWKMSWTEYARIVAEQDPVILVPVGAIEQHGPHLPLATDALIPTAVCEAAAQRVTAIVAPTITYGYKSMPRAGDGQHFSGTTSVDAATLVAQIRDLIREFARHKIRNVAFVVGHLENQWHVTEACDLAARDLQIMNLKGPRLMQVGYWEFITEPTVKRIYGDEFPNWPLEHAGIMETSIRLHIHPELVHMKRLEDQKPADFPVYDLFPYDPAMVPASGILNTAKGSTAEKGVIFFDEFSASLASAVTDALK